MTNKYVDKKWASDDWSHDPAWLYENKQKKFAKFVNWYKENTAGTGIVSAPAQPEKKGGMESSDDDVPFTKKKVAPTAAGFKAPSGFSAPKPAAKASAPVNLLDMDSAPKQ